MNTHQSTPHTRETMNTQIRIALTLIAAVAMFGLAACTIEAPAVEAPAPTAAAIEEPKPKAPTETTAQEQARRSAENYLGYQSFSESGLIGQLEFEGFSKEDATYGVKAVGADWKEQAALSAASYLEYQSFSRQGLIDQLIFEGFTSEQATYGVDGTGL